MRVEHGYQRGGALAYLAAWDAHRGRVFGRCEPTTGIAPFARLAEGVGGPEPAPGSVSAVVMTLTWTR